MQEVVERCWASIERAQANAVLRTSEMLKGAILDTSLDGFILIDHEGHILDWNKAAERMFGHERADVLGRKMGDTIFPERLREQHESLLAHYADGDAKRLERRTL